MSEMHIISKVVTSGDNMVEVYQYSCPIRCGHKRPVVERRPRGTDGAEKREDNLSRARQTVRRLCWANQGEYTKFVTLTYAKTELDIKKVRRAVTTFVQAMRRKGYDMRYLYVLEHQTERGKKEGNIGSYHVHMLIFIDKFIPYTDLNDCWKYGGTDITAIDNIKNLGAYVCKYITKQNSTEFGCRVFACSKGLMRSITENFYIEHCSDNTFDLQVSDVLKGMDIKYHTQMRHDFHIVTKHFEHNFGVQIVNYYQGTWKKENVIDLRLHQELLEQEEQLKDLWNEQDAAEIDVDLLKHQLSLLIAG